MKIHFFKPFSFDKNLGKAYNENMELLKNDEDWGVLMDGDVAFLDNNYGNIIKKHIEKFNSDEVGQFGCYASRTLNKNLRPPYDLYDENDFDLTSQKERYLKIRKKFGISVKEVENHITGFFICVQKKKWKEIPCPEENNKIGGVDVEWSAKFKEKGYKLLCMQGMYVLHYYRALEGIKYEKHLN